MMTIKQIEDEIHKLENGKMTYGSCQALASLYIIKDHMVEHKNWDKANEPQMGDLQAVPAELKGEMK